MTQEDKELLLKDLCARLPYGVICKYDCVTAYDDVVIKRGNSTGKLIGIKPVFDGQIGFMVNCDVVNALSDNIKPYLRPMSSMTEEERKEVGNLIKENRPNPYGIINNKGIDNLLFSVSITSRFLIDWLNKHHFDYRGLIEKGLAIKVTKENNPYKD